MSSQTAVRPKPYVEFVSVPASNGGWADRHLCIELWEGDKLMTKAHIRHGIGQEAQEKNAADLVAVHYGPGTEFDATYWPEDAVPA
jgi:hypothetical protein